MRLSRIYLILSLFPSALILHPRGQAVPLSTIVVYVQQIAQALQFAHERRLIHRDVKPDNMLVSAEGHVMLSDFGIVAIAHSTSSRGMEAGAGTPSYMAPEQMQGYPRPASDQYALAVAVYEWLTGTLPFQGTAIEVAMQHAMKHAPSLRERVPGLSPLVDQVVLAALAKDPKERFSTVQGFATAFVQAAQSQGEATFRPGEAPKMVVLPPVPPVGPVRQSGPIRTAGQVSASFTPETPERQGPERVTPPTVPVSSAPSITPLPRTPPLVKVVAPIDDEEILRRVRRDDLRADWKLFRPPAKSLFPRSFVLLLPEGVVSGSTDERRASIVVNYSEIIHVRTSLKSVFCYELGQEKGLEGRLRKTTIDLTYFEAPKELALSVSDDYRAFRHSVSGTPLSQDEERTLQRKPSGKLPGDILKPLILWCSLPLIYLLSLTPLWLDLRSFFSPGATDDWSLYLPGIALFCLVIALVVFPLIPLWRHFNLRHIGAQPPGINRRQSGTLTVEITFFRAECFISIGNT